MDSITIHPRSKEQVSLFEQMAKALKIPFEVTKSKPASSNLYTKEFNAKIKRAKEDVKKGNVRAFTPEDFEI